MAKEVAAVQSTVQAKNPTKTIVFKLCFMDESRFGLKTVLRRRITASGMNTVMQI